MHEGDRECAWSIWLIRCPSHLECWRLEGDRECVWFIWLNDSQPQPSEMLGLLREMENAGGSQMVGDGSINAPSHLELYCCSGAFFLLFGPPFC